MSHQFPTTSWGLVAASGGHLNAQARHALETLCERYWYPLYAFIRRQGYDVEKAHDLTQEFFVRIIEKNYVRDADRQRGRFRAFLLASLKHFLYNVADRERTQKRGGGHTVLPIELGSAEDSYRLEPAHDVTPEKIFERSWALALLETVMTQLQLEFVKAGKVRQFDCLKPLLTGDSARIPYSQIAAELGLSEAAVKVAVHRFRRRYRELLRAEIAETVAHQEDIDEEIRYLSMVLTT
jgi:RNA polymerase sigma-70 factor (ECF subfamily)